MAAPSDPPPVDAGPRSPTAQDLLLNFLGGHVLAPREAGPAAEPAVPAAAAIALCAGAGIGEPAVRSTLNRMVTRDLLSRERAGRTSSYRLTERSRRVLREGARLASRAAAVREDADVRWVLLGFNLPTAAQRERHVLRSRLSWAGFGLLQHGLWIAPAPADLSAFLGDDEIRPFLRIFSADAHPATDMAALAPAIWNLDALAAGYRRFTGRWQGGPETGGRDPLTQEVVLSYHWLELLRDDPMLPRWCLPGDWPAEEAQATFHRLRALVAGDASRQAAQLLGAPAA